MRAREFPARLGQRGMTLVEVLVALAIGLVVVLAASLAFIGASRLFSADAEAQAVEDSLRFAGFVVRGVVRQAGYIDPADAGGAARLSTSPDDPWDLDIVGAVDTKVSASDESFGRHHSKGVNQSDSLLVRFFGRTRAGGEGPDGSMVDCMGFAQPGPGADAPSPADRAWSFFYVAEAADKEPELYCKYRSDREGRFKAEPLARGIEVFKVVHGYDGDGDGVAERWLDAAQLDALAAASKRPNDEWRKVVALRVGMVARSARDGVWPAPRDVVLHPLGPDFPGVTFRPKRDGRLRRVAILTLMLRNSLRGPAS